MNKLIKTAILATSITTALSASVLVAFKLKKKHTKSNIHLLQGNWEYEVEKGTDEFDVKTIKVEEFGIDVVSDTEIHLLKLGKYNIKLNLVPSLSYPEDDEYFFLGDGGLEVTLIIENLNSISIESNDNDLDCNHKVAKRAD